MNSLHQSFRLIRRRFAKRIIFVAGGIALLSIILVVRLVWLQVISHSYYRGLADSNRISLVPLIPNRGLILDREGVPLARNVSTYTLEVNPQLTPHLEETLSRLARVVSIGNTDRKLFRKLLDETHGLEPVVLRSHLTETERARLAVVRFEFPEINIESRLIREYPEGDIFSHVVGYIGRITEADQIHLEDEGIDGLYRGTNYIGKLGIEGFYEQELHGVSGVEHVETDANGRGIRSLNRVNAISGSDLKLTVSAKLQQVAVTAFGDHRGALVAIEPSTGEVLAMVSQPGFDPNLFVDGIDQESWKLLSESPDQPLNDRALRGLYPPGSTVKPFMALAALSLGYRQTTGGIFDPGYFSLPGSAHRYRDWKEGGHGFVDLRSSIVESCDVYYYKLATDMGIDTMHQFFSQINFGSKTGIDIAGEATGVYPSTAWKESKYHQDWYLGETVIAGIGQGYVLTTPLQLAQAVAMIANDGVMMQPHLVRTIGDREVGGGKFIPPKVVPTPKFSETDLAFIREAMVGVTEAGGTAVHAFYGAPYKVGAKTGTAQVIGVKQGEKYKASTTSERNRDHALFVVFAPADHPKIALAIIVENGGHGGETAAPIARAVLDYYLLGKLPQVTPLGKGPVKSVVSKPSIPSDSPDTMIED